MADHLGYERYERGRREGNARNGFYDKTVTTDIGEVDLREPRDRQGTFEPHRKALRGLRNALGCPCGQPNARNADIQPLKWRTSFCSRPGQVSQLQPVFVPQSRHV